MIIFLKRGCAEALRPAKQKVRSASFFFLHGHYHHRRLILYMPAGDSHFSDSAPAIVYKLNLVPWPIRSAGESACSQHQIIFCGFLDEKVVFQRSMEKLDRELRKKKTFLYCRIPYNEHTQPKKSIPH